MPLLTLPLTVSFSALTPSPSLVSPSLSTPFPSIHTFNFIESSLPSVLTYIYILSYNGACDHPAFAPAHTLALPPLCDPHAPPDHPYVHSLYAYSAIVQLYTRSCQLDTVNFRFLCLGETPSSESCRFGSLSNVTVSRKRAIGRLGCNLRASS
ncbi:uncharacterized protein EDB91DRAFT_1166172 [Suillus paluster]|uniref:uncharacterized protein n=1 Tax=Suillus paluster TaxID=48578 RepID=UPI001B87C97B|nr:uncharacterized protein EDB91DRAFT_1166172 [Suillus paluster]KAG1726532.1 hypothetical protein EDB91DRAFT_1166172 [Suillus paluster]